MVNSLAGYDLDGVLIAKPPSREKPFFRQTGEERLDYQKRRREFSLKAELKREPEDKPYVIITARPQWLQKETYAWIEKVGLKPKAVVFIDRPRTRRNIIAFKEKVIRRLEITTFYEDDKKIARALQKLLPSVKVVLIE